MAAVESSRNLDIPATTVGVAGLESTSNGHGNAHHNHHHHNDDNDNDDDENDKLSSSSSLSFLLEQERERTQQLTLKIRALEEDNNALRDEISNLKKERVKHQLGQETSDANHRRGMANLQVELETVRKQVQFLTHERDELIKNNKEKIKMEKQEEKKAASNVPTQCSIVQGDYQMQIEALVTDKRNLLLDLDACYDRNNNQANLLKRLEAQMAESTRRYEKTIADLQKSLAASNNIINKDALARQQSVGNFSAASRYDANASITTTATTESLALEASPSPRNATRGRKLSPPRRNNSRLTRMAELRNNKDNYVSLRDLYQQKSNIANEEAPHERDSANTQSGNNNNTNNNSAELSSPRGREYRRDRIGGRAAMESTNGTAAPASNDTTGWGADTLPDGGTIQQSAQAAFLDAAVKKKKKNSGFWGMLIGGNDEETEGVLAPPFRRSSTLESEKSLLTREIMFNLRENERMMEEREKVRKAQEEAREIMEREKRAKAQQNVKQLKGAVKWGVFTMFKSIDEGDADDETASKKRDSDSGSVDTTLLREMAAKRTEGLSEKDFGDVGDLPVSDTSSSSAGSALGSSEFQLKRLSVMSDLTIPENIQEAEDEEEE